MKFATRYLDIATMSIREAVVDADCKADVTRALGVAEHDVLHILAKAWWSWPLSNIALSGEERGKLDEASSRAPRRSRAEVAVLCRELKALTSAGLSVVEALDALAIQSERDDSARSARTIFRQILRRLEDGRSLSSALQDVGGFPMLLIASVRSSERTSHLGEALEAYLRYDEMVGTLRRRVISAALYPAIVVALGLLITAFLLWFVIPRFAILYEQMGSHMGGVTGALLTLSRRLHDLPWLAPLACLTIIIGLSWSLGASRWKHGAVWAVQHVPALQVQWKHFELARLYEAFALLTRGGYSVHESLGMCADLSDRPEVRDLVRTAQQLVARGVPVSRAVASTGLTDTVTERLLRASEHGGDFANILHSVGRRHAVTFETFVERVTRVVEPLLLLAVAVLVGGTVVMLYMPIFDIADVLR